jgi:hypothetical protein
MLKKTRYECVDWVKLGQDMAHFRPILNTVMNFRSISAICIDQLSDYQFSKGHLSVELK